MAQESADALSAQSILPPAARVIMIHVDEPPILERVVVHAAGILLCLQKQVKQLLGQPVARNPLLPIGLLAGLRSLAMRIVSVIQPVAIHGLGCLAWAPMPKSTGTCRLLSRHPLAAPLLPPFRQAISRTPRLYVMTRRIKYSKIAGAVGFEPTNPSLVRRKSPRIAPSPQSRLIHLYCENHAAEMP